MKHTFGVAVLTVGLAVLVSGCTLFDREPTQQPSSVPSPTTATSSSPPTPSSSSAPTATTPTPSATPGSQLTAVPVRTPPPEPIVEGGSGAATDLRSLGFCDPDSPSTAAMDLTWRPAAAGEQLVAIATLPNGFETGRFTVSENLPADRQQYAISPVEPGGIYYWRVLTRSGDGWTASDIATFTGPTCVLYGP